MNKTLDRSLLVTASIIGSVASSDLYRTSWSVLDSTQGFDRIAPAVCMIAFGATALCAIALSLAVLAVSILDIVEEMRADERRWQRMDRLDALDALQAHQDMRLAQDRIQA